MTVLAPDSTASTARGGILIAPEASALEFATPQALTPAALTPPALTPPARGVGGAARRLAAGLAGEGWLAVIPHLYPQPRGLGSRIGMRRALTVSSIDAATSTAFGWLLRQGVAVDRLGVMGCELGGAVALIVATRRDLGAAVTIGGTGIVQPVAPALPSLVDVAPELRCPWLGIYPTHGEPPEEEVHKLRDAAHSARVATDLVRCGFDPDPSAAPEAWARILNWFDCHLR